MQTVEFNGTNYQFGKGLIEAGAVHLEDLTSAKLVELHNLLNAHLEIDKRVNKFADKKTALKRVATKLEEYAKLPEDIDLEVEKEPTPEPELELEPKIKGKDKKKKKKNKKKPSSDSAINFLGMRVDIKPQDKQVSLKREGSIRAVALEKLTEGATLKDLKKIFKKFDKKRGVADKDAVRRSYEMVRIFCYHYGYGTESSADGSSIKLITK